MRTQIILRSMLMVAAMTCGLAACGQKGPGAAAGGAPGQPQKPSTGAASAKQVARESRGDVDCPARIRSPGRDAKAPVDDVLGVRPGMTYDEAANVVLCTDELMTVQPDPRGFQIQTYGKTLRQGFDGQYARERVEKTSQQIMREMQDDMMARGGNRVAAPDVMPGQSKWYVGTMGLPGEERVINVAREEWFQESRNPTMDSVEQALIKKYGTPTRHQPPAAEQRYITWAYDPLGRLITETSPLFSQCTGVADPDGGANFSPDCGIVVTANIVSMPENHALSRYFQVGVVNQAGGYEALTQTEHGLQQLDAKTKAQQVKAATENADAPKL